jgi:hypothetical protein
VCVRVRVWCLLGPCCMGVCAKSVALLFGDYYKAEQAPEHVESEGEVGVKEKRDWRGPLPLQRKET